MGRKRKTPIEKKRSPIAPQLAFLAREIEHLCGEFRALRMSINILLEKHERDRASTIAVHMENERLRRLAVLHQEKEQENDPRHP